VSTASTAHIFFVEPGDTKALAARLREIMAAPTRGMQRAAGAASGIWTWDEVVMRTEEVYTSQQHGDPRRFGCDG
jgi:hypothetical protein